MSLLDAEREDAEGAAKIKYDFFENLRRQREIANACNPSQQIETTTSLADYPPHPKHPREFFSAKHRAVKMLKQL